MMNVDENVNVDEKMIINDNMKLDMFLNKNITIDKM